MQMLTTDFHTHLVPGVDDGSRSPSETILMARGLVALGVRRVHLTPHQFRYGNHFDKNTVEEHAAGVRRLLAEAEITLEVVAGAEYCLGLSFLDAAERDELWGFSHEGGSHLLAEFPPGQPFVGARAAAELLQQRGFVPVLAHPERYGLDLRELGRLRDADWRFQVNLPSLVGRYGRGARRTADALVAQGWDDFFGSDLHQPGDLAALRTAHAVYRTRAREVTA